MATTALDLWRLDERNALARWLRSGCDSIDALLRGGFRSGILTEICGEASAGKTQLCLQLLLQSTLPVQLGGLGGTACYICTEGIGSIKRLHELAGVYSRKHGTVVTSRKRKRERPTSSELADDEDKTTSAQSSNAFLDGIFIEQLYEADNLLDLLQSRLPTLLEEQNTKLVVIDSIAAVFRLEATASVKEASRRSRMMFHMANCMRILSAQYNVVFVLSNQVTGNFNGDAQQQQQGINSSSAFKPALGLSWSNCINQRLMITRRPSGALRRMEVAFSPSCPSASASFEITSEGVASIED
ncbi:DNA repair protein xrcc3 [Globisporangium polare]